MGSYATPPYPFSEFSLSEPLPYEGHGRARSGALSPVGQRAELSFFFTPPMLLLLRGGTDGIGIRDFQMFVFEQITANFVAKLFVETNNVSNIRIVSKF